MRYIRLLASFILDADLERDLLLKTNNNQELVNNIFDCLPNNKRNRNYAFWLLKLNPNDWNEAKEIIKEYFELVSKGKIDSNINNFNCIEDIKEKINEIEQKSNNDLYSKIPSGANLILSFKNYSIIELNSFEATRILCNTSKNNFSSPWCIARSEEYFDRYDPPYYLVTKYNKPYSIITENEIWNDNDKIDYNTTKELKDVVMKLRNEGYYVASDIIDESGQILEEGDFEDILQNI